MRVAQNIVTPEAVVLDFQAAGVASRILARAIDLLVQLAAIWAFSIAIGIGSSISSTGAAVISLVAILRFSSGSAATRSTSLSSPVPVVPVA